MALSLIPSILSEQNRVYPLTPITSGATIRLATGSSGEIGTLKVSGYIPPVSNLAWSIYHNPSWVSIEVDSTDASLLHIRYTNATPDPQGMHQFYVSVNDGDTLVKYPIAVDVKKPFFLVVQSPRTDSIDLRAYDAALSSANNPVTVIKAVGLSGKDVATGDVYFLTPDLPDGLEFVMGTSSLDPAYPLAPTSTTYQRGIGNTATIQVVQPSPLTGDTSGGVKVTTPYSQIIQLEAYQPGSMYDIPNDPDRTYRKNITLNVNTTLKGTFTSAIAADFDDVNKYFVLKAITSFDGGKASTLKYEWTVDGSGTSSVASTSTFHFAPSVSSGTVTFHLNIKDADNSNVLLHHYDIGPYNVSTAGSSWNGTDAIKLTSTLQVNGAELETVSVVFSTPSGTPTGTLTFSLDGSGISAPSPVTIGGGTPVTVSLVVPSSSPSGKKWTLITTVTSGGATGHARTVIESVGLPVLLVESSDSSITQFTGSLISPVIVSTAYPTSVDTITGATFYLVNAPAGLQLGAGLTITGGSLLNTLDDSPFTFSVLAVKDGYAPSYLSLELDVTTSATELNFSSFYSSVSSVANNTPFLLSWSYPETVATIWLQKNAEAPREVIINSSASLVSDSLFSLTGTNFYGTAYTAPLIITSDTTAALSKLPSSKTSAVIDSADILTIKWSPELVGGLYSLYKGWLISYTKNSGPILPLPDAETIITGLAGGTLQTRVYSYQLGPDNISMSMKALSTNRLTIGDSDAWSSFLDFPPVLIPTSSFLVDKTTAKLGESVTITMSNSYLGGDYWRVVYSDGKTSEWTPVSLKTITHTFSQPGNKVATIEVEKDYSYQTPSVSLKRVMDLAIFVEDEQYLVNNLNAAVVGNVGIGGAAGFEVADSSASTYTKEPYEVITKSLVKDEETQEIKLLIATSRNNNASSVLGTMALDVFPLQGRPHMKNLVAPSLNLNGNTELITPVKIITDSLPDAIVGKSMIELQLQASGGTTPYDWYSTNLPQGLTLNTDGTLSGTPMLMGIYNIDFAVKDSTNPPYIDSKTVTISVNSDIAIAEVSVTTPQVGTYYSHEIALTGGLGPYTWRLAGGELPIGLSIDPSSGKIVGFPCTYNSSTDFSKKFLFTPEVTDSIGAKASKQMYTFLSPMGLTLGDSDQTTIYKGEEAKFAIPVYGGYSPYTLLSLTSDGTIGTTVTLQTPDVINTVSGVAPDLLVITTDDQIFNPPSGLTSGPYPNPFYVAIPLTAIGGVPGYRFSIDTTIPVINTLPNAAIVGNVITGTIYTDGPYTIHVKVVDSDGFGVSFSKIITITANNNSTEAHTVTLEFIGVKKDGTNNTAGWTYRKLTSLPNCKKDTAYKNLSDATEFYGIGLWDNDLSSMALASNFPAVVGTLSTTVQGGAEANYTPLGISAFTPTWTITTLGDGVFNNGSGILPLGWGFDDHAAGPYAFFLFADSTSGAGIPIGNQQISKVIDPVFGPLSDYQIGTLTLYSITESPIASKSMFIYCADGGTNTTTTSVVEITSTNTLTLEGDIYDPLSITYGGQEFAYPLTAASGIAPYLFSIVDGSTLPGVTIGYASSIPALILPKSSPLYDGTLTSSYVVYVNAIDKDGTVSQTATINVNYVPKTASTNPVKIVGFSYLQDIGDTTPSFRGYTDADLAVLDMTVWANQDVVWSLPFVEQTNYESLGLVFTTKPDNSFQISGTPTVAQRYVFHLTASAVGAGYDTRTLYLDIVDPILTLTGPTAPLILGAKYNYATNHSVIKLSIEGYRVYANPVTLHTSLGTLTPIPTNVNVTSDTGLGHLGNPLYAQKWDAYYDFTSAASGIGSLTTTGGFTSPTASFSVTASQLVATGIIQPLTYVSEYATTFIPAPPLTISGGTKPYLYTASSISNPTNFEIAGGQLSLKMSSVSPTLQPGACDVTYVVTDSSIPMQSVVSTVGNVSIIVDAEDYIDAAFLPKEWVFVLNTTSTFPLYQCIQPKSGHIPYQWVINSADLSSVPSSIVAASATNRVLSYNSNTILTGTALSIRDFSSSDTLYEISAGVWVATPSGLLYSQPYSSVTPSSGRYTIPIGITVTDSKGMSVTGNTTITLIVP